jgi:hypothetical protein
MLGGVFLCFEGVEKLAHKWLHPATADAAHHAEQIALLADPRSTWSPWKPTRSRARSAPTSSSRPRSSSLRSARWPTSRSRSQVAVLSGIGVLMTFGVYGLVAGIVKLDDAGAWLLERGGRAQAAVGPRPAARGAEVDEGAHRDRHRGDVHGRRRHPDARPAGQPRYPAPPRCRVARLGGHRRPARRRGADPARHPARRGGRCAGAGVR